MNDVMIMMTMKLMSNNERDSKRLRPLNTLYGRDVIELESRECEECDYKCCLIMVIMKLTIRDFVRVLIVY